MKATSITTAAPKTLLILCTTTGYQTRAFVEAAESLGQAVTFGSDRCHVLDDPWQDGALALRFEDPQGSARLIGEPARRSSFRTILPSGRTFAGTNTSRAKDCARWD